MKIAIFSVLALIAAALAVQMPQKSVIVTYPQDTPDRVIDQAMDAIKAAGGYSACSNTPLLTEIFSGVAGRFFPLLSS